MGTLRGCGAFKFNLCKNLRSSVHIILVVILRYVRLNIKKDENIIIVITQVVWYFRFALCCSALLNSDVIITYMHVQCTQGFTQHDELEIVS